MKITENLGLLKPDQDDFYNVDDFNNNMDKIDGEIKKKVDKVTGKTLTSNDYTDEEKAKLQGVEENANNYIHPDTHPATMITQDSTHRFIADSERTAWNNMLQSAKDYSDSTYQQATGYTDTKIAALINGAPSTLDTLGELATAIEENEDIVTALDSAIGSKASDVEFQAHKNNTTVHVTTADKAKWNNMLSSSGGTVDGDTEFKNNKIDILTLTRKDTSNGAAIKYQNNANVLGYLGFDGSGNPVTWEGNSPTVSSMHTLLTSKNYNNYAAQKEHTHDNYLQLTGGNISGLTSFSQGIRGYTLSSSASHGKGQTGWSHAFKITTTGIYQNQFMKFSIVQRNRMGKMYIRLVSNTTAGTVNVGEFCTVGNIKVAYVCEDNVLDVYIYKSEAYDEIDCMITQKGSYMNGTDITWVDTVVSALPEGAVAAISNTNDTFTFTASRDGGTALVLDNTNSSDDRTYVAFKNKGQAAGYLSMSGNDLYTYKNSSNCKVLDTDNFNDSVSLKKVFTFTKESYGGTCSVYRYGMIIAVCISGLWATGNTNVLVGDTNFVGVGNQKHYVDEYGNCIQFTAGGEIYLCVKSSQGNSILSTSFSATALFMIHSA